TQASAATNSQNNAGRSIASSNGTARAGPAAGSEPSATTRCGRAELGTFAAIPGPRPAPSHSAAAPIQATPPQGKDAPAPAAGFDPFFATLWRKGACHGRSRETRTGGFRPRPPIGNMRASRLGREPKPAGRLERLRLEHADLDGAADVDRHRDAVLCRCRRD